ncbi:actin-binding LIM protein 2 isoform X2 [Tetranychus urticae]|uniref:actin-binding LIM protein 2 isoform X2 n=1 Tax=Tetranychus urticae TaxID=32264 RepID=UPI00077BAB95|nr:actin-binding LIM protein 2 isoform X2 [Tetranychus urticae]
MNSKKGEAKGKAFCEACSKKCVGNVLRVQERYFHIDCFKCSACSTSLAQGGFFTKDGKYYCTNDYQKLFGIKCQGCGQFVEGEVVTALGNTYHQQCFVCARCRQPFPPGEKVTYTGKECVCSRCLDIPVVTSHSPDLSPEDSGPRCSGCSQEIQEGQALIALDKQWHVWCFKCTCCKNVLHGEYMGKDGQPYCEKDYQNKFGVRCAHCDRYITGKVLQAGDNHHFHPTCARCTKCGDPFGDGEEMYMQGGAIWHPRCGPGPDARIEDVYLDGYDGQYGRRSPGIVNREPIFSDLSHVYTNSYLTAEPTQGYLRRPLEPRPPKSPQFHRPPEGFIARRKMKPSPKHGMQALVDNLQSSSQSRPRSPHMNNEEPIELAHYPSARKPKPNDIPRIERDDFPAPPFPYTDPERRRRWSGSSRDLDEDEVDGGTATEGLIEDEKLKREEEELSKIATGIGKVFLKTLKEREKIMAWKKEHLDPRNASRTPSAKVEPPTRLRYDNPVNASPSRDIDRPKPWEEDEFDRGSLYRSSGGKLQYYAPPPLNYNVVSSLRNVPKPGYGLKSGLSYRDGTLNGSESPFSKLEKTQSIDFNCAKSDISTQSEQHDRSRHFMNHSMSGTFRTTPFSDGISGYRYASYSPHLRRSMPNVNFHLHSNEPPKLYPYHLLTTTNYRLPPDVDRCHLERHLSNDEFSTLFHMSRLEFYRLPEWKRNDLKKRVKLY